MRRAAFTAAFLAAVTATAADYPSPQGFVNDQANLVPDDAEADLERELRAYEQATGIEIAVLTVGSLNGETIEDYAAHVFKAWGVGKKGKDNGVLLLLAPVEKDVRIEVGYGLEADLPDLRAHRIIDEVITPTYRAGDKVGAIVKGTQAIRAQLGDVPYADRPPDRKAAGDKPSVASLVMVVIGIIVLFVLLGLLFRRDPFFVFYILFDVLANSRGGGSGSSSGGGFGGGSSGGGGASGKL